ncbi:hypothetical protein N7522_003942 [Penicillium canescens]|nr:hypothetical protein N7522_003942 [Penicillium canescens]
MVSLVTTSHNPALPPNPAVSRAKMIPNSSPVPILKTSKPARAVAGTKRKMSDTDLALSPSSSQGDDFTEEPPTRNDHAFNSTRM